MIAKYLKEDCLYTDNYMGKSVLLEKNKEYDIEMVYDGPQMIINGQAIYSSEASIIVTVNNCRIPYAPNLVSDFWEVVDDYTQ